MVWMVVWLILFGSIILIGRLWGMEPPKDQDVTVTPTGYGIRVGVGIKGNWYWAENDGKTADIDLFPGLFTNARIRLAARNIRKRIKRIERLHEKMGR